MCVRSWLSTEQYTVFSINSREVMNVPQVGLCLSMKWHVFCGTHSASKGKR